METLKTFCTETFPMLVGFGVMLYIVIVVFGKIYKFIENDRS